ncbi:MAG: YCF48-related protein, partial [bacterium]
FNKLFALNDSTIFVTTGQGFLFRTTDGGKSWTRLNTGTNSHFNAVSFASVQKGFLAGAGGTLLVTADGGITWIPVALSFRFDLLGVRCPDETTVLAYGAAGAIFRSSDGGTTWETITFTTLEDLACLHLPSTQAGFVCGARGTIIRTGDNGKTWELLNSGVTANLRTIHMVSGLLGYAAGDSGIIIKTTDGGESWGKAGSPALEYWNSLWFIDEQKGFLTGATDIIYKTTDGGITWIPFATGQNSSFLSVMFSGATGFAAGTNGTLMRSTDEGDTWSGIEVPELGSVVINKVFCTDQQHWFLTGNRILQNTNIMFFASSADQGETWEVRTFDYFSFDFFNSLCFTDELTGYIAGTGFIIKTTDGGKSWIDQTPPISPAGPSSIFFSTDQNGVGVGSLGQILLTTNGGGVGYSELPGASKALLSQNYPNPFSGSTLIGWRLEERSHVKLRIFDSLGRIVITLVDQDLPAGDHSICYQPDELDPGVYFYRLITDRGWETKKFILTRP